MDPPCFLHAISDYPVNSINFMVEAAGIEPASEDIATRTSTSLVYNLILAFNSRPFIQSILLIVAHWKLQEGPRRRNSLN